MAKKTTKAEENIQAVEEALSKTEQFIEDNQKPILSAIGIIVLVILIYFGFQRFYIDPKEKRAQEAIFMAEKYFETDSLSLALNGDGINPGFLDIIDDYKFTKTAKLAHYYAGVVYLNKGNFDEAIEHLKDFDASDRLVAPMALGALGDCYMELNKPEKAAGYYADAAKKGNNEFSSPMFLMKAGWTYEIMGDYSNAIKIYKEIKEKYPTSNEGREMDKYIAKAEGLLQK